MKKQVFLVLALMLILAAAGANLAAGAFVSGIQEYYDAGEDGSMGNAYMGFKTAQTFTPQVDYTITSVALKLFSNGNPGQISVGIFATKNTTAGIYFPTGTALVTNGTNPDPSSNDSSAGAWETYSFGAGYDLTAGVVYAIQVSAPGAGNHDADFIGWRTDNTSSTYIRGMAGRSTSSGVWSNSSMKPGTSGMFYTNGTWESSDSTAPLVTINSPANNTYITSSIDFNITTNEDAACLFSLDGGANNITMQNNGNQNFNYTNDAVADGSYRVNFYCSDTAGNLNNTEFIDFLVDTTAPLVAVVYPANTTYAILPAELNFTVSGADTCWHTMDRGATNTTITCGDNATGLSAGQGSNTWIVYANDGVGNANSSEVTFFVDSITPLVTINSPANNTYIPSSIDFNITTDEDAACLFSLDGGANNITMQNNGNRDFNFTNENMTDGSYQAVFYCSDTAGNLNNTEFIDFSVYTSAPAPVNPGDGGYRNGGGNREMRSTSQNQTNAALSQTTNQTATANNSGNNRSANETAGNDTGLDAGANAGITGAAIGGGGIKGKLGWIIGGAAFLIIALYIVYRIKRKKKNKVSK